MVTLTLPNIENLEEYIRTMAANARHASRELARISTETKNKALLHAAKRIQESRSEIQEQNRLDLEAGKERGLSSALIDRLTLTDKRIDGLIKMLEEVAALPDPVGEITDMVVRPSGIKVGKMRVPLGVVGLIYESRPNVTVDAAALCLKSGNSIILRGGKEAIHSNLALANLLRETLEEFGIPKAAVSFVETTDREAVRLLAQLQGFVDVIIPRGGKALIEAVVNAATVPVLKHYDGNCHVYVDKDADPVMARSICINAKVQRPGVCNAAETFLIHKDLSGDFLTDLLAELKSHDVEIRGCPLTVDRDQTIKPASDQDWDEEYLDKIVALKIVGSLDEALDHIDLHSSSHTEAIVTENYSTAMRYLREVDSSSVMVNASTRFSDGGEYGLGAEMGISTDKLHARGPMGIKELTCQKFIVLGNGEIRE